MCMCVYGALTLYANILFVIFCHFHINQLLQQNDNKKKMKRITINRNSRLPIQYSVKRRVKNHV